MEACQRDFTINSLYYNIQTNKIEDPLGLGISDLKHKIVRPAHPISVAHTFIPRPDRIFCAVRFAEQFDLELSDTIIHYIKDNRCFQEEALSMLKPAQILEEFEKIEDTLGPSSEIKAWHMLHLMGLLEPILVGNNTPLKPGALNNGLMCAHLYNFIASLDLAKSSFFS